jgi:hypothetical protein
MATMNSGREERKEMRQEARALRTPEERQRRFFIHFAVYLIVSVALAALNYTRNPDHLWFQWVALGWGIGVIGHAVRAFGVLDRPMMR